MIRKNSSYYNTFIEIVKEFIQTITIVDDKAQFGTNEFGSSFDAGRITKQFADDGKICSVFKFTEEEDVNKIIKIAQKSDITILDWKIELTKTSHLNGEENEDNDLEEDVVQSKGYYTLEILKQIVSNEYNSLKLIVIYTDEPAFIRIVDEIKKEFNKLNIKIQDEHQFSFCCNNNKITLLGKEELKGKTAHLREIVERSYNYEELPEAVYEEFVNFTHGIVSGIFLKAIAAIRSNTYLLLNTFQRDMDAAFITHKALLPAPDDAHDHIIELIGSEIKCVINSGLTNEITNSLIDNFIDELDERHFLECKNSNNNSKRFTKEEFKSFLNGQSYTTVTSKNNKQFPDMLTQSILKSETPALSDDDVKNKAVSSNIKFAKLTTIRNRYTSVNAPILTLGVIISEIMVSGNNEYWICVQPKCDSIRIKADERRAFLFLSISKEDNNGEIIISSSERYKVDYDVKKLKQFIFQSTTNDAVVAQQINNSDNWYFSDSDNKHFNYIGELKNDFAQSIANEFASKISRVALNHSEWLRLKAKR